MMTRLNLRNDRTIIVAMILLIAVVFFASCGSDEASAVDCSGVTVTFTEVNSIIQSSCAKNSSCHASGSQQGPGALVSYSQIYNSRSDIKDAVSNGSMPKDGSLSSNEKNAILCWIENGASNN